MNEQKVSEERIPQLIRVVQRDIRSDPSADEIVTALRELLTLRQSASGEIEALHGGAQALSQMAHDMERRKIDKTEGLRNYAATLRHMAARMK